MAKQLDYNLLPDLAKKAEPSWKRFYAKNKKRLEKQDLYVHGLHDKFSAQIDCLSCANCCRSLGPRLTNKDVERMAKAVRLKVNDFMDRYLSIEDGDLVFQSMPCPFLGDDNYCAIYESRPKACREYPHTDRKRFFQLYSLSVKNASTCPIVFQVLEELNKG